MGFGFGKIASIVGGVVNPVALLGTGLATGGEVFSAMQEARNVKDTNAANELQAREQMQFSALQAKEQMAFQERMSGTAHQREVADLRAAGLNPLLALNSGASSPGGASGNSAGYTAVAPPSVLQRVIASAREDVRLTQEYRMQKRQMENVEADTNRKVYETGPIAETHKSLKLENELLEMRNAFFRKNPWAFKLNAASGGLNSASSIIRAVK